MAEAALHERPAELLKRLVRFDTTNPPGNERECIAFVESLLADAGVDTRILAKDDSRPNLIARLPGRGEAPALLLHGHVDVVTTKGQDWSRPPFEAEEHDGYIWGRGTLDMKGAVSMMVAAVLRAREQGLEPPGDVLLCVMSDEEAGSDCGAKFLTSEHRDLFEGARWALGEFGGSTLHMFGRRVYPIQVDEKRMCWTRARVRGPGGHGSMPMHGGAMARAGELLRTLDRKRLPVHITPPARRMVEATRALMPAPLRPLMRAVLEPRLTDRTLDLMGERGARLDPLLHNTVNATILRAGDKENVIPSAVEITLDGRLLPGQTDRDLFAELHDLLGDDVELETGRYEHYESPEDMSLFDTLADILREADPGAEVTPILLAAITDGRFFMKLGIQHYGFTPMRLPEGFDFQKLIHGEDERIPVDAVEFGTNCMLKAIERFGAAA